MKKILLGVLAMSMLNVANVSAQARNSVIKIGAQAPEIVATTPNGHKFQLSKLNKDSYVIVDFWASWCKPCRVANPHLVKMMKELEGVKLKDAKKGFKILSVSLDRNKESWLKGIEQDDLYWENHVSDLKHWSSEYAADYGVQFIPQVFLLNPKGEVVGIYSNVVELKKAIDEIVSKQGK